MKYTSRLRNIEGMCMKLTNFFLHKNRIFLA